MIIEKFEKVHIVYIKPYGRKNYRPYNIGHKEIVTTPQDATWLSEEEAIEVMNRLKAEQPDNDYKVSEKTVIRRIYQ